MSNTFLTVHLQRDYREDSKDVGHSGAPVTTSALCKLAASQLSFYFEEDAVSIIGYKRPHDARREYTVAAKIHCPLLICEDHELQAAIEHYVERLNEARSKDEFEGFEIVSATIDGVTMPWSSVENRLDNYLVKIGHNVLKFSPSSVTEATLVQVGDTAILKDESSETYVVVRIEEDGTASPIFGGIEDWDEAVTEFEKQQRQATAVFGRI